jgi:hypothetical protein
MKKRKDMNGKRFGKLLVLELSENNPKTMKDKKSRWKCECDCGKIVYVLGNSLESGRTKSCGCIKQKPFLFEKNQEILTKYGKFVVLERFRGSVGQVDTISKQYICKCLNCGEINTIQEGVISNGSGSCRACSESRSFGERFFYWFLKQNNIEFKTEYSPKWAGRRYYDFYFNIKDVDYIVEIDGEQHKRRYNQSGKTVEEIIEIDNEKDKLAKENNHILVRIKYEKNKGVNIKKNIEKSFLSKIFDLDNFDWEKCFSSAISNKEKRICYLWNNGCKSTKKISKIVDVNANYISKILSDCATYGLCDYNSQDELEKGRKRKLKNSRKIICIDNGMIFQGAEECSRKSEEVFGVYLKGGSITRVCRKERKTYKGFHFEYVD